MNKDIKDIYRILEKIGIPFNKDELEVMFSKLNESEILAIKNKYQALLDNIKGIEKKAISSDPDLYIQKELEFLEKVKTIKLEGSKKMQFEMGELDNKLDTLDSETRGDLKKVQTKFNEILDKYNSFYKKFYSSLKGRA